MEIIETIESNMTNDEALAALAAQALQNAKIPSVDTPAPSAPLEDDDDDAAIFVQNAQQSDQSGDVSTDDVIKSMQEPTAPVPEPEVTPFTSDPSANQIAEDKLATLALGGAIPQSKITDDDLRAVMPKLPENVYQEKAKLLRAELTDYQKNLIFDQGYSPEEALTATKSRMRKLGEQAQNEWLTANPDVGVIKIDKTQAEDIQLTEEEHAKLKTTKEIKLILVDDAELKTIRMDKVDSRHKADYIKTIDDALARYGVVLPIMTDFVEFKGAPIMQLATAIQYKEDSLETTISKQAALLWDRLIDGTNLHKYDENRKPIISYQDFANAYPYHDIDMGLYAILVASSMEENTMEATCEACRHKWMHDYNVKSILHLEEDMTDEYREHTKAIMDNRGDPETLKQMADSHMARRRYKSPYTNNIYDISYPSIAKAINLMKKIDQDDQTIVYCAALALYLSSMYVYNKKTDGYIEIKDFEVELMLESLQRVPDEDFRILLGEIGKKMMYAPKFIVEARCPQCGTLNRYELGIQNLIFHRALNSQMDIQ